MVYVMNWKLMVAPMLQRATTAEQQRKMMALVIMLPVRVVQL
jgi:hypothetical protein